VTVPAPTLELDVDGPAAPPRANGELVFAEPWEGRAFGLAMALTDAGTLSYDTFRDHLVGGIARGESTNPDGTGYSYYRCWLQALESALAERGLVQPDEVATRSVELADRPAGHDHRHDHDH